MKDHSLKNVDILRARDEQDSIKYCNTQLQCPCGSGDFELFQGSYLTAAKCSSCGNEYIIYEG